MRGRGDEHLASAAGARAAAGRGGTHEHRWLDLRGEPAGAHHFLWSEKTAARLLATVYALLGPEFGTFLLEAPE